jgi:hypothetical protein
MEGFADRRPVHGRISASFTEELHIRYDFRFKANDGEEHALRAEQCFLAVDPIGSFTTLDATIYDAQARERARALLRFDAKRELGPMVRSLRIDATFLPFQVS